MSDMDSMIALDRRDHPAALALWLSQLAAEHVAGRIGIPAPTTGHDHWLLLHRSEAEACMESTEYMLLSQQMGWT